MLEPGVIAGIVIAGLVLLGLVGKKVVHKYYKLKTVSVANNSKKNKPGVV